MNNYITNSPVALIFFNRPHTVQYVFEEIRKAQPPVLFLIQDGARENNPTDADKVAQCRKIVDQIDWECQVFRDYSETNLGCGRRVSSGIDNAFRQVDRLIILEDDVVPSPGFFRFCDELLEKYKEDTRISAISGMCHMVEYNRSQYTYAFSTCSSCTGWATWKRCWDDMDLGLSYLEDDYIVDCFKHNSRYKSLAKSKIKISTESKRKYEAGEKLTSWAHAFSMGAFLNNKLDIVPCKNLVKYIGVSEGSTHSSSQVRQLPKCLQKMCNAPVFELPVEIKHPPYIMEDVFLEKEIKKVIGVLPSRRFLFKLESRIRRVIYK